MKTLQTKLDAIRGRIEKLVDEREEIEAAPIPRSEAEARIAAVVNALFSNTVIDPGGPKERVDLDPGPAGLLDGSFGAVGLMETLNRPGAIRAIFPDALKKYLIGIYDAALGDTKPGLPAAERRKRMADLDAEIFTLETEEEAVIEQLEAAGANILRRADASAIAQLGLSPDAGEAA